MKRFSEFLAEETSPKSLTDNGWHRTSIGSPNHMHPNHPGHYIEVQNGNYKHVQIRDGKELLHAAGRTSGLKTHVTAFHAVNKKSMTESSGSDDVHNVLVKHGYEHRGGDKYGEYYRRPGTYGRARLSADMKAVGLHQQGHGWFHNGTSRDEPNSGSVAVRHSSWVGKTPKESYSSVMVKRKKV